MRRLSTYTKADNNGHLTDFYVLACSEKTDLSTVAFHKIRADHNMAFASDNHYQYSSTTNYFNLCYDI
jgi:hypothetical protein